MDFNDGRFPFWGVGFTLPILSVKQGTDREFARYIEDLKGMGRSGKGLMQFLLMILMSIRSYE